MLGVHLGRRVHVVATMAMEEVARTAKTEAHRLTRVEDFTALGLAVGGLLLLLVHLRRGVVVATVAMEEVARASKAEAHGLSHSEVLSVVRADLRKRRAGEDGDGGDGGSGEFDHVY